MDKTNNQARAVLAWFITDHGPQLEATARAVGRRAAVVAAAAVVATEATYRAGATAKAALVGGSQAFASATAQPAATADRLAGLVATVAAFVWCWALGQLEAPAAVEPVTVPAAEIAQRAERLGALNMANLRALAAVQGLPRSVYRTARKADLVAALAAI